MMRKWLVNIKLNNEAKHITGGFWTSKLRKEKIVVKILLVFMRFSEEKLRLLWKNLLGHKNRRKTVRKVMNS